MKLWLRVRRARTCALTIFVVLCVLVPANTLYLPVPNLLGGPHLAIPLALLVPIAISIAVAFSFTMGDPLVEAVASRPILWLDAAYSLSIAVITSLLCVTIGLASSTTYAVAAGRNVLGYVGLTLIGRRVIGVQGAALVPAGFVLVASLFGSRRNRQAYWWAWPLASETSVLAWAMALLLLVLGCALMLRRANINTAERGG